jgi:hypothetical protein
MGLREAQYDVIALAIAGVGSNNKDSLGGERYRYKRCNGNGRDDIRLRLCDEILTQEKRDVEVIPRLPAGFEAVNGGFQVF